jgi:hypothetical protein
VGAYVWYVHTFARIVGGTAYAAVLPLFLETPSYARKEALPEQTKLWLTSCTSVASSPTRCFLWRTLLFVRTGANRPSCAHWGQPSFISALGPTVLHVRFAASVPPHVAIAMRLVHASFWLK